MEGMSTGSMVGMVLIAIFYGGVISVILLSFWRIHLIAKDIEEIKGTLDEMKVALERERR